MATTYNVYVQTDDRGNIIYINSDHHLAETSSLIWIDKGTAAKYRDAMEKYLANGLYGNNGRVQTPNYKLAGGKVVERTVEEKAMDPYSDEPKPASANGADEIMDIIEGRTE